MLNGKPFDPDNMKEEFTEIKSFTDEQVKREYMNLWRSVVQADCYGVTDMCRLTIYTLELKRRGFHIQVSQNPLILHEDEIAEMKEEQDEC